MTRECGTCTACCEGWLESARMAMAPGHPCQHLRGNRCSIYPDRPENPCRNFDCGWKLPGSPLPDDMRPDQCGAIIILGQDWRQWPAVRAVPVGWVIPEPTLRRIKSFTVSQKMVLIYQQHEHIDGVLTQTQQVGFGPPDFMAAFREAMLKGGAEETREKGPGKRGRIQFQFCRQLLGNMMSLRSKGKLYPAPFLRR